MPDLYDLYYRINGKTQLIYYYYDETNRYLGLEYGNIKKDYIYSDLSEDALRRLKQIDLFTGIKTITQEIIYDDSSVINGTATTRIQEITYDLKLNHNYYFRYNYDNRGNIIEIIVQKRHEKSIPKRVCEIYDADGNPICTIKYERKVVLETIEKSNYEYDNLNQLIREDVNASKRYTMIYEYDNYGNILMKKKYSYQYGTSTNKLTGTPEVINYEYNNNLWSDQLTKFNGKNITYDESGNPIRIEKDPDNYLILTWEGRELVEYKEYKNGTIYQIITYKYNDSGYRTYKKIESEGNIKEHFYYLEGSKVKCEEINDNGTIYKIFYTYDIDGSLISFKLNTEEYFYIRNLQGDIVGSVKFYWVNTVLVRCYK